MIVSAVILAAGKSTRFPGNKMLKRIRLRGFEAPIITHTVRKFLDSGVFDEVVVVLGHDRCAVMDAAAAPGVKFVISTEYEKGMSYSVKAGVAAVMKYADVVAIHPGDVPFVLVNTLRSLVEEVVQEYSVRKDFIIIPKYVPLNKGGHPLMIGRGLVPYVMDVSEEGRGLKGFLNRFRGSIKYFMTDDLGVLADVDTPEDLVRDEPLVRREV